MELKLEQEFGPFLGEERVCSGPVRESFPREGEIGSAGAPRVGLGLVEGWAGNETQMGRVEGGGAAWELQGPCRLKEVNAEQKPEFVSAPHGVWR